jgi:hypothetical protein
MIDSANDTGLNGKPAGCPHGSLYGPRSGRYLTQ